MWVPALAASAPATVLMAEAANSNDPLLSWLSYGAVGAVAVALALGLLVPKSTHERAVKEAADARAQVAALQESMTNRAIPALTQSTLVLEALTPIVQSEIALRRATRPDAAG